jgi:hypothetical protein
MAKKSGGGKRAMSQKLSTGSGGDTSGMGLSSKMEGAASVPYKGHTLSGAVTHGAKGALSGTGQRKNAKVPQ